MNLHEEKQLKAALQEIGASRIIYALVMPETERVKHMIADGPDLQEQLHAALEVLKQTGGSLVDADAQVKAIMRTLHDSRQPFLNTFREAWTQKQDGMDRMFFDTWREWVKPVTTVSREAFPFEYPTAGASEGLRELIHEYGHRMQARQEKPEIHIFEGEYEGYKAYAEASGIGVVTHKRSQWQDAASAVARAAKTRPVQFYISQPSAIDGNVWPHYHAFMEAMNANVPHCEVIPDITYVGCIARQVDIRVDYPNVPAVVFSLSKPCGAYYDRIGGVVARKKDDSIQGPFPTLFGNKWFKNLNSLELGTQFMKAHGVFDMPRKYQPVQMRAMQAINERMRSVAPETGPESGSITLIPSDVTVLATAALPAQPGALERYLTRAGDDGPMIRVCLTPTMAEMIGMAKTHAVTQRHFER